MGRKGLSETKRTLSGRQRTAKCGFPRPIDGSLWPTNDALMLTRNLKSNGVPRNDKGCSQVNIGPFKANTDPLRPTNGPLGPAQGHLRPTGGPLRPTKSLLRLMLGTLRPTEPVLEPKEDPLRLTENRQTRPAQIDEGPLKPTNDALSYLKSNMTP